MAAFVTAVSSDTRHRFSKPTATSVTLRRGIGVIGDAHAGETVQHLSRSRKFPAEANLRQVHLIHSELHDELRDRGFDVLPGEMGENITTAGIDLLGLPRGARLQLGTMAVVEITGLRNPCAQLDRFRPGLMAAVLERSADGGLLRKAGVMAIVVADGEVRQGDAIHVALPEPPHQQLDCV